MFSPCFPNNFPNIKTYIPYRFLCWENALGTLKTAFPIPNIPPLKRKLGLLSERHGVKFSQPNVIAICTQSVDMLYDSICFSVRAQ